MNNPPYTIPVIDGDAIILDNSTLECFRACERKYQHAHLDKRVSIGGRPSLNFGRGVHEALAWRYKTCGNKAITAAQGEEQTAMLQDFFLKNPQPQDGHRQPSLAVNLMRTYNEVYGNEPWSIVQGANGPIVEASFPSDQERGLLGRVGGYRIIYAGRIDLDVEDSIGAWVMDHKTAFMFGDGFEKTMRMTPQMVGYCWTHGRVFDKKPIGYIVNAIRVRKPTREDSIVLDTSGGVRRDDFKRIPEPVSDERISEWVDNTLAICDRLVYCFKTGTFPMNTHTSCVGKYGPCQYLPVCSSPRTSREVILATDLYEDNDWSPLNKPTEGSDV